MTISLLFAALQLVQGRVTDASTAAPIAGASVHVVATARGTLTDSLGRFTVDAAPGARLRISAFGYATAGALVPATGDVAVALTPVARSLEGVVVRALRLGGVAPISEKDVDRPTLERSYFGQDMPHQLAAAPSMTMYADAGSYSGYSYMRLRGIDQTRINLTIDGIPLNESEDQGFYFQNIVDFGNSIESVQIQRGVGTSTNGTASYAGSVNFESVALAGARRGGEVQLTRGSYDTDRGSVEYHTGSLGNGFAAYGRVSGSETDGYRRHSGNRASSFFGSAGWFGARDIVKVTAFGGVARNHLAYIAAPLSEIDVDPRANPMQSSERDRFWQQVGNIAYTRVLAPSVTWTTTAYGQQAGGDFDVFFAPDITNFDLASTWVGALSDLAIRAGALSIDVGAHGNSYRRDHFAFLRPNLDDRLYSNRGRKREASGFVKGSYDLRLATLFADVQVRHASFHYTPDAAAEALGVRVGDIDWTFVNPKVGVMVRPRPALSLYASYGSNGREPTRADMFAGFDDVDTSNVALLTPLTRVRPERVRDLEIGARYSGSWLALEANVFDMRFRNEIAPIGPLSYIGLPLRKNVPSSLRQGVEVDASVQLTPSLAALVNATVARNRIREFTDDASGTTYRDVEPLLTPRLQTSHSLRWDGARAPLTVGGRYVARTFLTNTGNDAFVTPPWYAADASLTLRLGRQALLIQGNNLFDRRIFAGGYTDGTEASYYVMAGRNVFVTVKAGF
jgi:iron complex outermembrane receptor protein